MPSAFIVDDEEQIAKAMGMLFKLLGFEAHVYYTAQDLARGLLAAPSVPDILLLDMVMPHVSGMDVLQWIRSSPRFKPLRVIVLSAETDPRAVDRVLQSGADAYLFKPVTLEELKRAVSRVMRADRPEGGAAGTARP